MCEREREIHFIHEKPDEDGEGARRWNILWIDDGSETLYGLKEKIEINWCLKQKIEM